MLTIIHQLKIMVVFILACGLLMPVCQAETAASYSGRYTADLEQKQMLLESIKEDADATARALKQDSDKDKESNASQARRFGIDRIDLAEIVPHSDKIHIAFMNMNGTLSPQSGRSRTAQNDDRSHD